MGKLTAGALRSFASTVLEGEIIGETIFPPEHPVFAGHFPGRPLVPGVLLLDYGLSFAGLTPDRVDQVKFLRPVRPAEAVRFRLRSGNGRLTLTARVNEAAGTPLVLRAVLPV